MSDRWTGVAERQGGRNHWCGRSDHTALLLRVSGRTVGSMSSRASPERHAGWSGQRFPARAGRVCSSLPDRRTCGHCRQGPKCGGSRAFPRSCRGEAESQRTVRPEDHQGGCRALPRDQSAAVQDLPTGADHAGQQGPGGTGGGHRRQLLRRARRRGHQAREPAAPVGGPPARSPAQPDTDRRRCRDPGGDPRWRSASAERDRDRGAGGPAGGRRLAGRVGQRRQRRA